MDFIELASQMLGGGMPVKLEERLRRVNQLCMEHGGSLISRQVVASIVEQWEREQAEDNG